ncbi:hypothetical protein [Edaphobacter acidisoli]|nr:hypothetical protein [Edaphobacter acidisoli]
MTVLALLSAPPTGYAQLASGASAPPATLDDALHQMADKADVIFAGQVIAIHQHEGQSGASGFVEVDFRVDQAVRGCAAGMPYALREWAGLWEGGARRYHVGEQLLMFLHAPGPSGLSSPVSGMDGAVPIHGGSSPLTAGATTAQYPMADLRWVGTHVMHPVSYRAELPHFNHRSGVVIPFLDPRPMVRANAESAVSANVPVTSTLEYLTTNTASASAQQAPVQSVIGMIRSWQKASDATH